MYIHESLRTCNTCSVVCTPYLGPKIDEGALLLGVHADHRPRARLGPAAELIVGVPKMNRTGTAVGLNLNTGLLVPLDLSEWIGKG